jgi:hypothetical protein
LVQKRVQDLLRHDSALISKLITKDGATVYVSGDSKMAEEVLQVFTDILAKDSGVSLREAYVYLLAMKVRGPSPIFTQRRQKRHFLKIQLATVAFFGNSF